MKTWMLAACTAFTVMFAADASAELYKCVKDGKTSYQEQPCGDDGATQSKIGAAGLSPWVGCYDMKGSVSGGTGTREPTMEVRQDGGILYSTDGTKDGPYESRLLWTPATPKQLRQAQELLTGKENGVIEVTSGLVMSGAASGPTVKSLREDEILMGYWWIRGDLQGRVPLSRAGKEQLVFIGPGAVQYARKTSCAQGAAIANASEPGPQGCWTAKANVFYTREGSEKSAWECRHYIGDDVHVQSCRNTRTGKTATDVSRIDKLAPFQLQSNAVLWGGKPASSLSNIDYCIEGNTLHWILTGTLDSGRISAGDECRKAVRDYFFPPGAAYSELTRTAPSDCDAEMRIARAAETRKAIKRAAPSWGPR